MKRIAFALSLLLFFVTSANAQYAYRIRPYPAAPATCQPGNGDVFFLSTGAVGLYQCVAANTWAVVGAAKLSTAQHGLVQELFGYMEDHRRRIAHAATFADFGSCDEAQLPPLLLRMMKLPPLSSETWREWHDTGRLVIEASTEGNPFTHPAFIPGGKYASLATLDNRDERPLWKRLSKAWKLRAQEMARLPEHSPHRKRYSRR